MLKFSVDLMVSVLAVVLITPPTPIAYIDCKVGNMAWTSYSYSSGTIPGAAVLD